MYKVSIVNHLVTTPDKGDNDVDDDFQTQRQKGSSA